MKSLAPNTLLQNRYLIVHLIGKGGMGEVYLAVDQRLGSAIALKRTLHGDNAQLGDAFEREARTLARLRHPALPKVSDHFIENDNQYLVMDHISGDDLSKRLNTTQKPFPLSWVLFWADQLLDALAYLHSHEPPIIHRDIKPQNLKLTDDNNIVLLDFGLSKNSVGQTISNASGGGSGSTGSVVGYTPHYAPMEQIRGTGTNPKSDIYSLSATLYQLLTNIVPPDALSRADFLLSGKQDPIAPINEVNNEIPKSISDVILKGMSISQDQRYGDAREMQKILRETYAKMQSEAADKTIAFNVQDEQPAPVAAETSSTSNDKTEQFSAPVLENQTASKEAMGAQTIPFGMMPETVLETPPTASQNADKTEQIPNFDATIRIDDVPNIAAASQIPGQKTEILPVADTAAQQSNVKTEVFGGDFGAAEYLEKNKTAAEQQNFVTDEFNAKTDENIAAAPSNFTGDKTVPFIKAGQQNAEIDLAQTQPASAFNSLPQAENFGAVAAETRLPAEGFSPTNQQASVPPVPNTDSKTKQWHPQPSQVQPKQKKSKGLLFGILGALFGLVILAAAGGGIAWYLMTQKGISGATNTATPTPEPSIMQTPTPTPEQANTGNTSNSEVVTTNSPDNSNVNTAPSPEQTKTVVTQQTPVTTKTVTTRPTQVTTNTPRTATPKPTVKTETKPTVRGGIIPQ
ncbi:MAG TPA: protein kinase [Pyrinomonadaceae bacterium]|nr:protein kinase [Pyrinomonadaceae bacterium]